jgi:glycosyltransferase involved in cell wall biosynthesis
MARQRISVLIHTLNEVDQIAECLRTVEWADEVYLLDSFSEDGTVDLIEREFPAVVVERRESLGSAAQKNYGMTKVANDWVLVVDADERVTPGLRDEILDVLQQPKLWAYGVRRRNFILGKRLRFSGLQRDTVIRLFHREHARYPNRRVHADLLVDGDVGRLKQLLDHNYVRSLDHLAKKTIRYAVWGAAQLYRDGARPSVTDLTVRPVWRFFRDWILNLGILDGHRGLVVCAMHAHYTFMKYAKLWEYHELARRGESLDLPEFEESHETWALPWEEGE